MNVGNHQIYLQLAKIKDHTLYRNQAWNASKNDPESGLFVGDNGQDNDNHTVMEETSGEKGKDRGYRGGCGGCGGQRCDGQGSSRG